MPSVSIIIPVYNGARFLGEAIESARSQTHPPAEIVVVDDGSSDNSAEVAENHAGIRVIRQKNAGPSAARNRGAAETTGDYLLFLDADDRLLPEAAALHLAELEADPGLGVVYGAKRLIDEVGRPTGLQATTRMRFGHREVARHVSPSPSQTMYRADVFRQVGGYRAGLDFSEDVDLNLRLCRLAEGLAHEAVVCEYRRHAGQVTHFVTRSLTQKLRMLDEHFGPGGLTPDVALRDSSARGWKRLFGPWLLIEAVKSARRGEFGRSGRALVTFSATLPHSAAGVVPYLRGRLARRTEEGA